MSTRKTLTKAFQNIYCKQELGKTYTEIVELLIPVKGLGEKKAEKLATFIVEELIPEFPEIDAVEQVRKKTIWWRDKPLTKDSRPHAQMRAWFRKAQEWIDEAKAQDQVGKPKTPYQSTKRDKEMDAKRKEISEKYQEDLKAARDKGDKKKWDEIQNKIRNEIATASREIYK